MPKSKAADEVEWIEVNRPDEIPRFSSEDEEAEFWSTHGLGPGMFENAQPDPNLPPPRAGSISIRFEGDIILRLRTLAKKKGTGYRALLKEFVIERLYEEEKREGLVGKRKER